MIILFKVKRWYRFFLWLVYIVSEHFLVEFNTRFLNEIRGTLRFFPSLASKCNTTYLNLHIVVITDRYMLNLLECIKKSLKFKDVHVICTQICVPKEFKINIFFYVYKFGIKSYVFYTSHFGTKYISMHSLVYCRWHSNVKYFF